MITPEVCVGEYGELTWIEESTLTRVQLLETGTCRLALSAVGAERTFEGEFTYEANE